MALGLAKYLDVFNLSLVYRKAKEWGLGVGLPQGYNLVCFTILFRRHLDGSIISFIYRIIKC